MASVSHNKSRDTRAILFTAPNGKRRVLRLGHVTQRDAETTRLYVEDILSAKRRGGATKPATDDWLTGLDAATRDRLVELGLIEPVEAAAALPTVAVWIRRYIDSRTDVKENTRLNFEVAFTAATGYFGDRRIDTITKADAKAFRVHLKEQNLSEGTIRRRVGRVKQFFAAAVDAELMVRNPFRGIKCGDYMDPRRFHFVTPAEAKAVLGACPDAEWRAIFALARYGGLRCPSEILNLTWADVDWEKGRFTVHASKTEHHDGAGVRIVPLFPELLPYLQERFDEAEPGTTHIITRYRDTRQNLRTQLTKIIKRAGLVPWPKLFQNCRSTRETELVERYPDHVVVKWLGNSPDIARRHYLQVTDDHFKNASQDVAHNVAQHTSEPVGTDRSSESGNGRKALVGAEVGETVPTGADTGRNGRSRYEQPSS